MYNIYNSTNFCKNLWRRPKCVMVLGVMNKGINGLTSCIIQYECMTPISAPRDLGTVKAGILKNYSECKGLISVSFYNIKPVHFLSMNADSPELIPHGLL